MFRRSGTVLLVGLVLVTAACTQPADGLREIEETRARAAYIAGLVVAYRDAHGDYPETLAQLNKELAPPLVGNGRWHYDPFCEWADGSPVIQYAYGEHDWPCHSLIVVSMEWRSDE